MRSARVRWARQPRRMPSAARQRSSMKRWVFVERLEDRIALSGLLNGDFSISNPSDPNYGWTTQGNATIANGEGILNEGTSVQTGFSQSFTIAPGTTELQFTIVASDLVANGALNPPGRVRARASQFADRPAAGRAANGAVEYGRVPEYPADRRGVLCSARDGASPPRPLRPL